MKPCSTSGRRSAGFSLIELLVAMAIGLIVTLAITSVLIRSEGGKRSTTSVNDINQTGAYVTYVLDRAIRNAGTGYTQSWSTTYGCLLNAKKAGTQVLPPTIPTTSAFGNFQAPAVPAIRLSPVIIGKSLADVGGATPLVRGDVWMVMGGTAGAAELPLAVTPGSVTATQFLVTNTLGYRASNIVLLADAGVPGGCMLQQVDGTVGSLPQVVPLSGTYYSTSGSTVNLFDFGEEFDQGRWITDECSFEDTSIGGDAIPILEFV